MGALFGAAPHPGPCDVLGTAVELFGEVRGAPDVAALQVRKLNCTCRLYQTWKLSQEGMYTVAV